MARAMRPVSTLGRGAHATAGSAGSAAAAAGAAGVGAASTALRPAAYAAPSSYVRREVDAALRVPFPTLPPSHPLCSLVYAMEGVRVAVAEAGVEWRDTFSSERWVQLRDLVAEGLTAVGVGVDVLMATARSPSESWETLAVRLAATARGS